MPGLSPDRADIIVAGGVIVERVMNHLQVNRLQVHDGGVRDGLIRSMGQTLFPPSSRSAPEPPEPMRSVQQFVYRQLMYLVIIESTVSALVGARAHWRHLIRTGDVEVETA